MGKGTDSKARLDFHCHNMVEEERCVHLSKCLIYLLGPRLLETRPQVVDQGVLEEHPAVLVLVSVECEQEYWLDFAKVGPHVVVNGRNELLFAKDVVREEEQNQGSRVLGVVCQGCRKVQAGCQDATLFTQRQCFYFFEVAHAEGLLADEPSEGSEHALPELVLGPERGQTLWPSVVSQWQNRRHGLVVDGDGDLLRVDESRDRLLVLHGVDAEIGLETKSSLIGHLVTVLIGLTFFCRHGQAILDLEIKGTSRLDFQ